MLLPRCSSLCLPLLPPLYADRFMHSVNGHEYKPTVSFLHSICFCTRIDACQSKVIRLRPRKVLFSATSASWWILAYTEPEPRHLDDHQSAIRASRSLFATNLPLVPRRL